MLKPDLAEKDARSTGTVLLGSGHGDIHNIGKNLVGVRLKGAGSKAIGNGVNVPNDAFIRKIEAIPPDILGLSAFLATTMPPMKEVIEAIKQADFAILSRSS